ncbi:hypothetical protein PybrP1_001887 [[Pythium] brassicae (nom. inval.)]|nr:hypothetical protein PybrP1_001887 [[Pythium] brassicae (nom. inval.)]
MDGKYVLQNHDGDSVRSDADTPVYLREDEDDEGIAGIPGRQQRQEQQDFRLFRHRGFWMFADVGVWPPATHFRCDPTKRELVPHDIDVVSVCQMDLGTPPSVGYSPAQPNHAVRHLALSEAACSSATGGVASSQSQHQGDATDRAAAAAAALASRVSEL